MSQDDDDDSMTAFYRDWKHHWKERRQMHLVSAQKLKDLMTVHTKYHWSTMLQGKRLDYWPSGTKWRWDGKTYRGTVDTLIGFLKNRNWRLDTQNTD